MGGEDKNVVVSGCSLLILWKAWRHRALGGPLCPQLPYLRLCTKEGLGFTTECPSLPFCTITYHMDLTPTPKAKFSQDPRRRVRCSKHHFHHWE